MRPNDFPRDAFKGVNLNPPGAKLATSVFKFGIIAWLVWAGISLTFFGIIVAVAWHFIAKYW